MHAHISGSEFTYWNKYAMIYEHVSYIPNFSPNILLKLLGILE